MKKKLYAVMLMLTLVFVTTVNASAATSGQEETRIGLRYISISKTGASIRISGSNADYNFYATKMASSSVDYVNVTLKLVDSKGTIYQTLRKDVSPTSIGKINLNDTKILSKRGTYHAEYTAKVYGSGRLIETISGKSATATY